MVLRTFRSDCEQRGPLNEHPVVDVRARCALLRTWTRTTENVDAVGDLVQSQENQPQTHCCTRQISREIGMPQTN